MVLATIHAASWGKEWRSDTGASFETSISVKISSPFPGVASTAEQVLDSTLVEGLDIFLILLSRRGPKTGHFVPNLSATCPFFSSLFRHSDSPEKAESRLAVA